MGTVAREINTVGVVGLGTMGAGIVEVFARNGLDVVAVEITEAALERGRATLTGSTDRAVAKGKLSAADRDALLARVDFAVGLERAARASTWSSRRCPSTSTSSSGSSPSWTGSASPTAILATNTSLAVGHRDLGRHPPAQPGHRHALLQPGADHEAGRGRPDRGHRARGGRRRRGAVRPARQGRRDHQRPGRLHRQRAALRLPQPRRVDVRGPLRHPRGHRRGDEARLRPADGPARADGPDRPRHRVRDPRHDVPPGRPRPPARAGAAAQADGHGRAARPQDRPRLLHLREAGLAGRRGRRADPGRDGRRAPTRPVRDRQGRRGRLRHHGHRHHRGLRQGRLRGRLGDPGRGEVRQASARRSRPR